MVAERFTDVEIIRLKTNRGFAGGINVGIKKAIKDGFEFIALFNNDAAADPEWLQSLHEAAIKKPECVVFSGKLLRDDHKHIDSTGEFIGKSGMPYPRGRDELDRGQYETPGYVFAASGGASLYRSSLFKKIGYFDEDFFAYYEDVDLCFRAQLLGLKVWYEPAAIAFHRVGHTSSKMGSFTRYHSVKNYIMLYNKNMPGHLFWARKPIFLWQLVRMKLGSLRDHQFGAFVKAFFWALIHVPATLKKRSKIQRTRTVSSKEILNAMEQK